MEALRTLLIAGHPELSERIHRLKGIEIIDEDDDPDVVVDILNYEDADLIIVNTLLSQAKSLKLAIRAREKQIKVIALTDDKKSFCESRIRSFLTEKGIAAYRHHEDYHRRMTQAVLERLDEEELPVLVKTLDALSDFFKEYSNSEATANKSV